MARLKFRTCHLQGFVITSLDPEVIKKKVFMLSSGEHEIFPAHNFFSAHKCQNANGFLFWHFNIYEQERKNSILGLYEPEKCRIS